MIFTVLIVLGRTGGFRLPDRLLNSNMSETMEPQHSSTQQHYVEVGMKRRDCTNEISMDTQTNNMIQGDLDALPLSSVVAQCHFCLRA